MAMKTPTTTRGRTGGATTATETEHDVIRNCANVCNETLVYCLSQGGDHVAEEHIKSLIDCAELCNVTANFVARDSDQGDNLMEICAEACKACEESCEEFEDDETMKRCADACRDCYEFCSQ